MNKVDVLVGQRIRARRQFLSMTQSDLGQAVGVRFQQIQKYETGANRVSASRLWAIADVLGMDIVHFFDGIRAENGAEPDGAAEPTDHLACLSNPETLELIDLYANLPGRHQKAVLGFIRSMVETDRRPEPVRETT
jgi:transcriptional regulator with XRE-family HTH domain